MCVCVWCLPTTIIKNNQEQKRQSVLPAVCHSLKHLGSAICADVPLLSASEARRVSGRELTLSAEVARLAAVEAAAPPPAIAAAASIASIASAATAKGLCGGWRWRPRRAVARKVTDLPAVAAGPHVRLFRRRAFLGEVARHSAVVASRRIATVLGRMPCLPAVPTPFSGLHVKPPWGSPCQVQPQLQMGKPTSSLIGNSSVNGPFWLFSYNKSCNHSFSNPFLVS